VSLLRRLVPAFRRRVHGPYLALEQLDSRVAALEQLDSRLADVQSRLASLEQVMVGAGESAALARETHQLLNGEVRATLRALVAEESANRRRLDSLRESRDYDTAWTSPSPLVSITVATTGRAKLLAERSLPSILGQTYGNLEVIVVGDDADPATEEAVCAVGDRRLTYRNLTHRVEFTDDAGRWLAGATLARNEAMRLATGCWVMCFDDDDAMAPTCVERLLLRAREERFEAIYGRTTVHMNGPPNVVIGDFPPRLHEFSWASGMYHAGLRFFARELIAADLGLPGDWYLAQRMLRAGVRFGWVSDILADYYPSTRFGEPGPAD
jgi:hypothetical protein